MSCEQRLRFAKQKEVNRPEAKGQKGGADGVEVDTLDAELRKECERQQGRNSADF